MDADSVGLPSALDSCWDTVKELVSARLSAGFAGCRWRGYLPFSVARGNSSVLEDCQIGSVTFDSQAHTDAGSLCISHCFVE
jgi:hypothetical protein